jgi:hypothetical protein
LKKKIRRGNVPRHLPADEAYNYRWYFKNRNYIMAARFQDFPNGGTESYTMR